MFHAIVANKSFLRGRVSEDDDERLLDINRSNLNASLVVLESIIEKLPDLNGHFDSRFLSFVIAECNYGGNAQKLSVLKELLDLGNILFIREGGKLESDTGKKIVKPILKKHDTDTEKSFATFETGRKRSDFEIKPGYETVRVRLFHTGG